MASKPKMPDILLASTSPYRKASLEDIGLKFSCVSPPCDESEIPEDQAPQLIAEQRAQLKAMSVSKSHPDKIVIGSDQLAHIDGEILGKPGTKEKALEQLEKLSGKTHTLVTSVSVCLGDTKLLHTNITQLKMKKLDRNFLTQYVEEDNPIDCAGSYKIEKNGLWLFESIETEDHSAIQGLPLLATISFLEKLGYQHFGALNG